MEVFARVLVLGSEPDASVLAASLTPCAAVTRVETTSEAFELLEAGDYDALFCQWEHPEGTWRTVFGEIQNRQWEVPFIVFCHCGGEREWIEVLEAGAFDFLVPPYTSNQIVAVLEHALASSQRTKERFRYAVGA